MNNVDPSLDELSWLLDRLEEAYDKGTQVFLPLQLLRVARVIADRSTVPVDAMLSGELTGDDWGRISAVVGTIATNAPRSPTLRNKVRCLVEQGIDGNADDAATAILDEFAQLVEAQRPTEAAQRVINGAHNAYDDGVVTGTSQTCDNLLEALTER